MSPKELNYIEDALGHEEFLKNQCMDACKNLQDPELKDYVEQMQKHHEKIFQEFYSLV